MEQKYIVSELWEKSYSDPIVLQKDDIVTIDLSIKDSTPGWENWVWCVSASGLAGWVPAQILHIVNTITEEKKNALVLEDYSANELTVEKGEILIGTKILNGWVWCSKQNKSEEGWIPLSNVEIYTD